MNHLIGLAKFGVLGIVDLLLGFGKKILISTFKCTGKLLYNMSFDKGREELIGVKERVGGKSELYTTPSSR